MLDFSTISSSLSDYILDVKNKTDRDVEISPYIDATLHDARRGSLEIGPTISAVEIRYRPLIKKSNSAFEKLIAHELTHALMVYKEGFHIACASPDVSEYSVQTATEVIDLVDDVIVDVRIHKLGFYPNKVDDLGSYIRTLEILNIANSRDQIDPFEDDPIRAEIMFAKQYIYAWALPRYVNLSPEQDTVLDAFTRRFPQIMKKEFAKARVIKKSFQANDIFSVSGRTQVVIEAMGLWPIDDGIFLSALSAA